MVKMMAWYRIDIIWAKHDLFCRCEDALLGQEHLMPQIHTHLAGKIAEIQEH